MSLEETMLTKADRHHLFRDSVSFIRGHNPALPVVVRVYDNIVALRLSLISQWRARPTCEYGIIVVTLRAYTMKAHHIIFLLILLLAGCATPTPSQTPPCGALRRARHGNRSRSRDYEEVKENRIADLRRQLARTRDAARKTEIINRLITEFDAYNADSPSITSASTSAALKSSTFRACTHASP